MSVALMTHIVQWALVAATVTMIWWVAQYTMSSPWWRDPVGRNFVLKDFCLLALLIPSCLLQLWPHLFTITEIFFIELCVFGGITVVMAWRCIAWWRIRPPRPGLMWQALRHRNIRPVAPSPHRHCPTCRCVNPEEQPSAGPDS